MQRLRTYLILAFSGLVLGTAAAAAEDVPLYLRAYPRPIPEDTCFETVPASQAPPAMRPPVRTIGWKHHPVQVRVTPAGALVLSRRIPPGGLCLTPLVGLVGDDEAAAFDPDRVSQGLVDDYMPGIQSAWLTRELRLSQLAFCSPLHVREVETDSQILIALSRYTLTNRSNDTKRVLFWLSFEGAGSGDDTRSAHRRELSYEPPFVLGPEGEIEACVLTRGLDVSFHKSGGASETDPRMNSLRVELKLAPGESRSVDIAVACFPLPRSHAASLTGLKLNERLALFRRFWSYELSRNARFIVPEKRVMNSYRASLARSLILTQRGSEAGLPSVYNEAVGQLLRGQADKFVWTFYSLLAYGTDLHSQVIDMLRIALALEDGETLHLLPGTPRGWLADGKTIEVRRAPTCFGEIDLEASSKIGSGEIRILIDPPKRRSPNIVLHVRPPVKYGFIHTVTVNGARWEKFAGQRVDLGKLDERAEVVCTFLTRPAVEADNVYRRTGWWISGPAAGRYGGPLMMIL